MCSVERAETTGTARVSCGRASLRNPVGRVNPCAAQTCGPVVLSLISPNMTANLVYKVDVER
jgi:hypothetical protein